MTFRFTAWMVLAIAATPLASGQIAHTQPATAPAKPTVFEVISIRPNKSGDLFQVRQTPDGLVATGVTMQNLIRNAYNLWRDPFWSGEPAWLTSAHFDVQAKFDPAEFKDATQEQRRAMLRALLADRLKLVVHHATKEFPAYALVVDRNGPKMPETKPEDIHGSELGIYCRASLSRFRQCSMKEFADTLTAFNLGRPVVDRTGLTARYDFDLSWDLNRQSASAPDDQTGQPSIFGALAEQLGLKLESTKASFDTIVIDHVEMPSGD